MFSQMRAWREIQEDQWEPQIGDLAIKKESLQREQPQVRRLTRYERFHPVEIDHKEYPTLDPRSLFYWMPREDQLEAMVEFDEEDHESFKNSEPYDPGRPSGEPPKGLSAMAYFEAENELLLAFIMKKKFNLVWRSSHWGQIPD